jgi:hypothetical protein
LILLPVEEDRQVRSGGDEAEIVRGIYEQKNPEVSAFPAFDTSGFCSQVIPGSFQHGTFLRPPNR